MQLKEYIDDTEDFINIKLVRASPTTICKIPSEKVQLFILAIAFFIHSPKDSLFYYLLALRYYFSLFSYYILFS